MSHSKDMARRPVAHGRLVDEVDQDPTSQSPMRSIETNEERSRITLVLIECRGHSGSNLLDVLISGHGSLTSVGELKQLSRTRYNRDGRPLITPCACGETPANCDFWQRVEAYVRHNTDIDPAELDLRDGDLLRAHMLAVLNAVAEISGARIIVDSSKNQPRLARLLDCPGLTVRPIFLIRGAVGNVAAHVDKGYSWRHALDKYKRSLINTSRVLRGREHLKVRYESLVRNPERELRRIMKWLGLPFESTQLECNPRRHHRLVDNRKFRVLTEVTIRPDRRWREALTIGQVLQIALGALPVQIKTLGFREAMLGSWLPSIGRKKFRNV